MSTKQKSFFEQDKKLNRPFRPNYNRTRSANDVSHATKSTTTMQKPDIAPPTQTKTKLKAFQFIEGRPSSQRAAELDKENHVVAAEKEVIPHANKASQTPMKSSSQPEPVEKRLPPSTPAPRIPLADLLGNGQDSRRTVTAHVTPEEDVRWVHAQTPGSSQPAVTPARKRKRVRSSSPASSQQEPSNFFPGRRDPAGRPQGAVQTPQVDPALDLWQRYANGAEGPNIDKSAAFAHLIRDPSPHSPASAGSVGGLRRWASCGIEWPQSATKRRRISRRVEELSQHDEEIIDASVTKGSKVGALLERMKETLVKPSHNLPDGPSSSSPLPDRSTVNQEESPLQHRLPAVREQDEPSPSHRSTRAHSQTADPSRPSSDYGDDELDTDMIDAIAGTAKLVEEAVELGQSTARQSFATATSQPVSKPSACPSHHPVAAPVQETKAPDSDEFDDDDDDLLAVDLDQITADYTSQHRSFPTQVAPPNPPVAATRGDKAFAPVTFRHAQDVQVISDDEFGDDDIDDEHFALVEAAATQAYQASGHPVSDELSTRTIQRYHITAIHLHAYSDDHARQQQEKVLVVEESQTANVRKILLRQSWFDTPATIGSYVHVTGTFNSAGDCIIDNASNILILHPDHLISATVVADSFGCIRRAVLQDRVKATGEASPPMMYGHILHELFQEAMKANQWDNASLKQLMDAILPRHYETMVEIGLNLNQVHEHLKSKFQEMQSWAELFVRASPTREAVIKGRNGQQAIMCINKLLDVEEHIWSPKYGLKGNVDATVQATIRDGSSSRVLTLPFELKTGKRMNEQHVAQTALYTLLTSDRYDVEITEGVLYYLENSHTTRVQAIRHELIHLVMKRNELACYVRERLKLPPMLPESRQRMCNNCYAQTTCFLHHKLAEAGTSDTLMNKGRFEELVKYLKPLDQIFFMKWDQLLTKEESEMKKFTRELWTMPSKERETRGRCFSGVVIEPGSAHELAAASKINRFQYTFVKQITILGFSFTESQITVGEPIVVSDEKGHYALANGYVTHVHKKRITVAVDRRLHNARTRRPGFNSQTNQDFIGVMEALATQDDQDTEPVVYRLDKDEFSNGMATARNNLLQIMDDTIYKAADLRAMVVQDRAPRFKAPSGTMGLQSQNWQAEMNSDQKAAVEKVMAAQDYALVLGMPGTGKTTTIAQIIRALVAQGKSVLLTSYTHTAVDNILLKVRDAGFDVLRLGVLAKVHPQVQEFAILAAQQKDSLEEVQDAWCKPPVVATTCLGVNHPIFGKRTFDYCIVDEASQITLPVCLGPIRMAKTFVLVGDHFQLPPLVQNKEAQEGGLDMSLFRLLSERHLDAVVSLEHQYRMCADIMHLSNTLIYDGRLKCGTETVATQALLPPHPGKSLKTHHFPDSRLPSNNCQPCSGPSSPSCHISLALQPENKVLFLNTDTLHPLSTEILSGPRITNPLEAALTSQLVVALLDAGVPASEVGVITFYRSQLAELRQMLRGQPGLELHTADRFQGRDKEAVVVSFVRNNADRNVGELLRDWRRINVAVTRAKSKLILVGSKSTLSNGGEVLKGLVDVCEKNGWMHDLKSGEHTFPELGATQFSGKTQQHSPGKKALRNSSRKHAPPPSVNVQGRKPLTEIGGGQLNRKTLKMPEKRGKINEKGLIGSRPVLRDIMHDIFGDEMEN